MKDKIIVDKNNLDHYKLKITTLSPVHIGTGEVYEPTNYVVDDGFLYEFDEMLFLKILPYHKQQQFIKIAEIQTENGYELFEKVHAFIIQNKEYAKKVAVNKVKVSTEFEKKYHSDIAKKVQIEGGGQKSKKSFKTSVFNKFEIQKTLREANKISTYLSGSSIKGAIATAYQELIFKQSGTKGLKEFEQDKAFKNLVVSDTLSQKSYSEIAFAINEELFEEDDSNIYTMIEVNSRDNEYLATLTIKDYLNDEKEEIKEKITKEKIIKACNSHYKVLYNEQNKPIQFNENQFLLSVGKHSGARAVTIDGLRKILVKLCQIQNKKDEGDDSDKRVERLYKKSHFESEKVLELFSDEGLLNNKEKDKWTNAKHFLETPSLLEDLVAKKERVFVEAILTQETTIWKFSENKSDGDDFGWLLCEFIPDNEYEEFHKEFLEYEKNLIENNNRSRNEVLLHLQKEKDKAVLREKEKEQKEKEEAELEAKRKIEEKLRLSNMSPTQRQIEEFSKKDLNVPKHTLILNGLSQGLFKDKCEALKILKEEMIRVNKWKIETKAKKPEKDKDYKNTLKVIAMIKECFD